MNLPLLAELAVTWYGLAVLNRLGDDAAQGLLAPVYAWVRSARDMLAGQPAEELSPELVADWIGERELGGPLAEFLEQTPVLRRAQHNARVLDGARILWVDDVPKGNRYETQLLKAFGAAVESVRTTAEARARAAAEAYDLILSDMDRAGEGDRAGLDLLSDLRRIGALPPLVFYVGHVDADRPVPLGAAGIADRPDELLHLVLDVLERDRQPS